MYSLDLRWFLPIHLTASCCKNLNVIKLVPFLYPTLTLMIHQVGKPQKALSTSSTSQIPRPPQQPYLSHLSHCTPASLPCQVQNSRPKISTGSRNFTLTATGELQNHIQTWNSLLLFKEKAKDYESHPCNSIKCCSYFEVTGNNWEQILFLITPQCHWGIYFSSH